MANGEFWIAREIYRRESIRLKAKTPVDQQDERFLIITEWLDQQVAQLDKVCRGN